MASEAYDKQVVYFDGLTKTVKWPKNQGFFHG
jgi:hypothetical protein